MSTKDERRGNAREWLARKIYENGGAKSSEEAVKKAREIADKTDKQNDSKKKEGV